MAYADNMGLKIDHGFCYNANELSDIECAQQVPYPRHTVVIQLSIFKVAEFVVNIERSLAMASWPDTELRNYKQQYNPFKTVSEKIDN